ncbi:MAG TPA: hypothetical protein ENG35_04695 [Desulfobacteraceae bacterium]|nr:hypothetical protein [Desulfobacteraceae bacterium]
MESQIELRDLKDFFRRRKKSLYFSFITVILFSGMIAFILPSIYLSESTILVEGQQIPREFVKSTITNYIGERLKIISQKVLSRSNLMDIIKNFNLYSNLKDKYTTEQILKKMKKDIKLETIDAPIRDKRTGRRSSATIAFKLSFQGSDPAVVQKITNVLASLYIQEDIKNREKLALVTTDFLEKELKELEKQILFLENKISQFKKEHIGVLPGSTNVNMQAISRLERDIDRINTDLRNQKERKNFLKGQIASVEPLLPVMTDEGKMATNPKTRLKRLRLKLLTLQSTLTPNHPDVKKLKKVIKELEVQVGTTDDSVAKIKKLKDLKGELAVLSGKLGQKHPDTIRLTREIETLSAEVDKLFTQKRLTDISEDKPDNPTYIYLMTQITSTDIAIKSLMIEKSRIQNKLKDYQRKIENAPIVEREYNDLTRDYETAKGKYKDINNKLMEARIARGMEVSQRGERFTIIEPAYLPQKPYKPNRMAIMLLGFVLAAAVSLGFAATREALDHTVRTADHLNKITGLPVFSVIPLMETDSEKRIRITKRVSFILILIVILATALVLVDRLVMPLDILWLNIYRRLL